MAVDYTAIQKITHFSNISNVAKIEISDRHAVANFKLRNNTIDASIRFEKFNSPVEFKKDTIKLTTITHYQYDDDSTAPQSGNIEIKILNIADILPEKTESASRVAEYKYTDNEYRHIANVIDEYFEEFLTKENKRT